MKSWNMKSTTGREPVMAAPQASPTKPRSQIGVSHKRSGPYFSNRPTVVRKLPALFVCENNQYATEVPFRYASGNPSVSSRGAAYGMPGVEVDGNDVLAVCQAAEVAAARARRGDGPTLIECLTYRTRPHAEGMGDFTYRTKEEVEGWKKSDPIRLWRERLVGGGAAGEQALAEIDAAVQAEVDDAIRFGEGSPWPDGATACENVFSTR